MSVDKNKDGCDSYWLGFREGRIQGLLDYYDELERYKKKIVEKVVELKSRN